MNTTQLECFVSVAEHLNYAKAADEMHLSQPAVTKKIQSLEEELGIRLFERDTRHVSLTYAGKQFFSNAKSILMQERNALASIAELKAEQKRTLVIGTHNAEIYRYVGKVLAAVHEETKDLSPDIVDAPFQALNLSLNTNSVDIVLGTYEIMHVAGIRESAFCALAASTMYCLTPHRTPEKNIPFSLQMDELDTGLMMERLMVSQRITCHDLEQYITQNKEWRQVASRFANHTLYCDNMEACMCLVEAGAGILFMPVPDFLKEEDRFYYIPISDAKTLNYGYFYNRDNYNPVLKIFRDKLQVFFDTK